DNMIINEFDNGDIDKNSTIINPLVTKRKRRPETKQYKSAVEKA
ncbi:2785_t:CDS:1, partial [Cetraspora pellucida]